MCGIVGYVGHRDCTDVLVSALTKLEYRGYDSAGIAVFENGKIAVAKTKGRLSDLTEKWRARANRRDTPVSVTPAEQPTANRPTSTRTRIRAGA